MHAQREVVVYVSDPTTYEDMLAEAGHISDVRKRDNLRLGDLIIMACGPAVIGRPSNDNPSIIKDFEDVTGFRPRTLQQYRQVSEFYTPTMREWMTANHVFYTWMRDAMTKAFREFPDATLQFQRSRAMHIIKEWYEKKYDTEEVKDSIPPRKGVQVKLSDLQLSPDTIFTKTVREDGKIILRAVL